MFVFSPDFFIAHFHIFFVFQGHPVGFNFSWQSRFRRFFVLQAHFSMFGWTRFTSKSVFVWRLDHQMGNALGASFPLEIIAQTRSGESLLSDTFVVLEGPNFCLQRDWSDHYASSLWLPQLYIFGNFCNFLEMFLQFFCTFYL